jgi:hypothetical protein
LLLLLLLILLLLLLLLLWMVQPRLHAPSWLSNLCQLCYRCRRPCGFGAQWRWCWCRLFVLVGANQGSIWHRCCTIQHAQRTQPLLCNQKRLEVGHLGITAGESRQVPNPDAGVATPCPCAQVRGTPSAPADA